jgi:NAD(P)-dependent dehydrogenase (short-subunit alcohol dehydrogenase family)
MIHDLTGKVAIVTGASRGLGKAIAVTLASCGAKVALNYFGSPDLAQKGVQEIRAAGGTAQSFRADVRDETQVRQLVAEVEKNLGPIEVLVLNATGPQPFRTIEEATWKDYLNQLEFFVKSPLLFTKAVLPGMKSRRSGRIINIGSEVFEKGGPKFSNYVAAKGAQLGLTRSWAVELAEWNITVNLVAPGWIPTERHDTDPQAMKDEYAAAVPMKRMGVPSDIGSAVAFLASDGANFITGQKISVNGGNTLE